MLRGGRKAERPSTPRSKPADVAAADPPQHVPGRRRNTRPHGGLPRLTDVSARMAPHTRRRRADGAQRGSSADVAAPATACGQEQRAGGSAGGHTVLSRLNAQVLFYVFNYLHVFWLSAVYRNYVGHLAARYEDKLDRLVSDEYVFEFSDVGRRLRGHAQYRR